LPIPLTRSRLTGPTGKEETEDAIGEIRRCSGTQFDPVVVEAFLRWLTALTDDIKRPDPEFHSQRFRYLSALGDIHTRHVHDRYLDLRHRLLDIPDKREHRIKRIRIRRTAYPVVSFLVLRVKADGYAVDEPFSSGTIFLR